MNDDETVLSDCRKLLAQGVDRESVLTALRRAGFSKVQSIKALVDLGEATLGEAKEVVHRSETWKDVRERDEASQRSLSDDITE